MLVLASLSLPVADIETDLDGAGYSLIAKRWDLDHQRVLVRNSREEGDGEHLTDTTQPTHSPCRAPSREQLPSGRPSCLQEAARREPAHDAGTRVQTEPISPTWAACAFGADGGCARGRQAGWGLIPETRR